MRTMLVGVLGITVAGFGCKGFLSGSTCQFCTAAGWVYKSANIQ